jgi:hypothetical protein
LDDVLGRLARNDMPTRHQLKGGRTDRETFDRALMLAAELFAGRELTAKRVIELTGVAMSTAHRDLYALEACLPVDCEEIHQKPWPNPKKVLRLMRPNT